ncbi:DNA damage-regulated autophagy modulator protein 2-like isoform X3 [Bolinopsis microptera]|uniref:DNA damage-regulated autophagy modulator protein 2-like isoform X3 n=1 Tax=Bolinopsis microptera TaxID=2820187 RepID=UPI00307AC1D6
MAPPPHLPVQCSKTMTVQGFGSLLGYLPFLLTLLIGGGIVMCYCMAVAYGHVEAAFPYISDTGTFPPESCVFTLFLNCAAVVLLAIFTLKYLHVVQYNRQCSSAVTRINTAALVIGYVAAFGIMVVGAFQETNVLAVHVLGAMMAFIGGTVYMFLIASLGFRRDVNFGVDERGYAKARLFMAFLSAISFIIMNITTGIAIGMWHLQHQYDHKQPQLWSKNDDGYNIHLVATAFEWVMALDLLAFLMTFSQELHIIQLQVVLVRHPLCSILSSPAVSANSQHTTQDVLLDTDNELCES